MKKLLSLAIFCALTLTSNAEQEILLIEARSEIKLDAVRMMLRHGWHIVTVTTIAQEYGALGRTSYLLIVLERADKSPLEDQHWDGTKWEYFRDPDRSSPYMYVLPEKEDKR